MSKQERPRETITLRLRAEVLDALRDVARDEEMSISYLVEAILAFNLRLIDAIGNVDFAIGLQRKARARLQKHG